MYFVSTVWVYSPAVRNGYKNLATLNRLFNLFLLSLVKLWSRMFYNVENHWLHPHNEDPWKDVRLVVFLNHTSLFEFLFLGAAPWRFLFRMAGKVLVPAAITTIDRPVVGKFFKMFGPGIVPISRERDATWDYFLKRIREDAVVFILPEGRMKRITGLDKDGKPMSVRGGVADILKMMETGKMVIVYSGGLHHVQVPGQGFPRFFKTITMHSQKLDIADYIREMEARQPGEFKKSVVADLQERRDKFCPPEQPVKRKAE